MTRKNTTCQSADSGPEHAGRPDERVIASVQTYSRLANTSADPQVVVGRVPDMKEKEPAIFADICHKLAVRPREKLLSVGVGCGQLAGWWISMAAEMEQALYLNDFPDVLTRIRTDVLPRLPHASAAGVHLIPGVFPVDTRELEGVRFDCIDIYSVIHYTDEPFRMVEAAVALLAPGGRLLIGDVPNLDKKGRFLATKTGRAFEAIYRHVDLGDIPVYGSHQEFTRAALASGAAPLTDAFLQEVLTTYRGRGYDVFVLNQPPTLPFCHTREDILIVAPHD